MNMVSDLSNMMAGFARLQGCGYIYGELWELNDGTERHYPCVLVEPLDAFVELFNGRTRVPVRAWVVDQVLVTDDTPRPLREDTLRAKATALVLAVQGQEDKRFQLARGDVETRAYTGDAGADALVAIRVSFEMMVNDCEP